VFWVAVRLLVQFRYAAFYTGAYACAQELKECAWEI
jgi:hypothetical protein